MWIRGTWVVWVAEEGVGRGYRGDNSERIYRAQLAIYGKLVLLIVVLVVVQARIWLVKVVVILWVEFWIAQIDHWWK